MCALINKKIDGKKEDSYAITARKCLTSLKAHKFSFHLFLQSLALFKSSADVL